MHPPFAAPSCCTPIIPPADAKIMTDRSDGQRQCRRRDTGDVELDAAMALADMAGAGPGAPPATQPVQQAREVRNEEVHDDDELASTRLSLELGKVGIQSSPCSSSSSAGPMAHQQSSAYGPRPRHVLTEAEKEAKRLRRVLANRESARQTILRRQAIRDELARKVADLSSQNESMKKEKETVMQEYLSLKETNKHLKEKFVAKATKDTTPAAHHAEATASTASPQPGFLYTTPPPAVPVPYVWGSWPGYERGNPAAAPAPSLCLPPYAWYYPVAAADQRGSPPTSGAQQFQEATSGGTTAEEETDDDRCSLTLALDVDRTGSSSRLAGRQRHAARGDREKAATAAEARKRRKEVTRMKQTNAGGRSGHG